MQIVLPKIIASVNPSAVPKNSSVNKCRLTELPIKNINVRSITSVITESNVPDGINFGNSNATIKPIIINNTRCMGPPYVACL